MNDTYTTSYRVGRVYYEKGSKIPFTGVLYGKYSNGNYLSIQEYTNGVGNGKWVNYYDSGELKEVGTYVDNRVEGPYVLYYLNGNKKAEGKYKHWKIKVGEWTYYNEDGSVNHTETH
ncbi:hypothetical protein [Gangjinia marincola]